MTIYWQALCWRYGKHVMATTLASATVGLAAPSSIAQLIPDDTLGADSSFVTPNVQVRGEPADRIDGGATSGTNLFHSFDSFGVEFDQRVYFSNPLTIENILTRVTGNSSSDIYGILGVDGDANLFLINPNGILFGPDAQLDINGSFTATTADSVVFTDGGEFSATNPGDVSLLSVDIPLGVQYGPNATGTITNKGILSVGQDFSISGESVVSTGLLSAPSGELVVEGVAGDVQIRDASAQTATFSASNNLILQESQIQTMADLNLLAGNTVQMRDSVVNPLIVDAVGDLLVQGNQSIDIFALNHPSSGLVSGGDMVLRSANAVGGDTHYWSGGSFRIEQLDGTLGNLFSPYDPVITVAGDVNLAGYTGNSLHILAGGEVNIPGAIAILGVEVGAEGTDFLVEVISLSSGETVSIDGSAVPTLDIRAGADINVGDIFNLSDIANGTGQIYLASTGQNSLIQTGNIIVFGNVAIDSQGDIQIDGNIDTSTISIDQTAGNVTLLAPNGGITLNGDIVTSDISSITGIAGNISLLADGDIRISNIFSTSNSFILSDDFTIIRINSEQGSVILDESQISAQNLGIGFAGDIFIGAGNEIQLDNSTIETDGVNGRIFFGPSSEDLDITSPENIEINSSEITSTESLGIGSAGEIFIGAENEIRLNNSIISTDGEFGLIFIGPNSLEPNIASPENIEINNSEITSTENLGIGLAGDIFIGASGEISIETSSILTDGNSGRIFIGPNSDASGILEPQTITINNSLIGAAEFTGTGVAGDIFIGASDDINIEDSFVDTNGNEGEIFIGSNSGETGLSGPENITINNSLISSTGFLGTGVAGDIFIGASGDITIGVSDDSDNFDNSNDDIDDIGDFDSIILTDGNGGEIFIGPNSEAPNITAPQNITINNSLISSTESTGTGVAGDIFIGASGDITIGISDDSDSLDDADFDFDDFDDFDSVIVTDGNGGEIFIGLDSEELGISAPQNITVTNSLIRSTEDTGDGVAGDILIGAIDNISIEGSKIETNGNEGEIFIGPSDNNPDVPLPQNITIKTGSAIISEHRIPSSESEITGNSGDVSLQASQEISIEGGSVVLTGNIGRSGPGSISLETVQADGKITLDGSSLASDNASTERGGSISIRTNELIIQNAATVQAISLGVPGEGGSITIVAESITLTGVPDSSDTNTGLFANSVGFQSRDDNPEDGIEFDVEATEDNPAGSAGSITVNASGSLVIEDGAEINVGSFPSGDAFDPGLGDAGNLIIEAGWIHLDNGIITAIARAGDTANIEITLTGELLLLENESLISAGAEDRGGGGNLTIIAENGFILADPFTNNDILANAFKGPGGKIDITTNAIFGLEERDPQTPFSDINAASEFNLDGTVVLNTLNIDPTRGLGELPIDIVDASSLVVEGCVGSGLRDTDTQGEFTRTGRSGLSPNPTGVLMDESLLDNQSTLSNEDNLIDSSSNPTTDSELLVEAQGLVEANGKVSLAVSTDTPSSPSPFVSPPDACDAP